MLNLDEVKFDEKGLIPAVVQDVYSGEVLTVAYMNRESLAITLEEKRTCFFSRSRQKLWRKGEESGNVQRVVSVMADCDADALLLKVEKAGPACHTGETSCFHKPIWAEEAAHDFSLQALYEMLKERKESPKEGSYTSYLYEKGLEKILKKVGEECTEVVIGGMKNSRGETVYEIADLCYHVMVLMVEMGITNEEILTELASRHVVDKKVKQETAQ